MSYYMGDNGKDDVPFVEHFGVDHEPARTRS